MTDFKLPKGGTLLIDTNFLIDSFEQEEKYSELLQEIRELEIDLASIDLVRVEFIRSRTKDVVRSKATYFSKVIQAVLPIDQQVLDLVQPTIEEYGNEMDGVALTDIFLACFIKRYKNLFLLTRNHRDFPTKIFTRSCPLPIENDRDIKTYALYQYKPTKSEIETHISNDVPF